MPRVKINDKHVGFGVQESDQVLASRVDDIVCVTVRSERPRFEGQYDAKVLEKARNSPELRLYISKRRARSLIAALSAAMEAKDISL